MKTYTHLALAVLTVFCSFSFTQTVQAQNGDVDAVYVSIDIPEYWDTLSTVTPAIDFSSGFNSVAQTFSIDPQSFGLLGFNAFTKVLNNPLKQSSNFPDGQKDLMFFFSHSQSQTKIGEILQGHISGYLAASSSSTLQEIDTDAFTHSYALIESETGNLKKLASIDLFVDLMLEKLKKVPRKKKKSYDQMNRAEKLTFFYLYTQTIIAHELYGNAADIFSQTRNQTQLYNDMANGESIFSAEEVERQNNELRKTKERQAYQAGIDFLNQLLQDDARLFDIQALTGSFYPNEDDATYSEIKSIVESLIAYEQLALDGWSK